MSEINNNVKTAPQLPAEAAGTLAKTEKAAPKETNTPSPLFNSVASPETAGSIASAATSSNAGGSASVNYSC